MTESMIDTRPNRERAIELLVGRIGRTQTKQVLARELGVSPGNVEIHRMVGSVADALDNARRPGRYRRDRRIS